MLTGLILVVLAASGVALTVLVVVVVAIRQEPRDMELSNVAPSRVAIRVRRVPAQAHTRLPPPRPLMDRSEATSTPESPQPGRSVAKEPELLSPSYRNRVRKLSPRNQNRDVKHLPGWHTWT
jgi:hypothetical protein